MLDHDLALILNPKLETQRRLICYFARLDRLCKLDIFHISIKVRYDVKYKLLLADNSGTLTYNIGKKEAKEDSGEVPVLNGYKSVETTQIRTPDTRTRGSFYPDSAFINRNVRDEYDIYPNFITNPSQWKPSSLFNNINLMTQQVPINTEYNTGWRISKPAYQTPGKFHRRISDDGMKEFYCKRCRELSGQGYIGCPPNAQQRNHWVYETTTPKMKLDGKLAKLN